VRRIGARTDLPLTSAGQSQADRLGIHIQRMELKIDRAFSGTLRRTEETAVRLLAKAQAPIPITKLSFLNEIDLGPDENQTEEFVRARLGDEALNRWDAEAEPPSGWFVDRDKMIHGWRVLASELASTFPGQCILIVSSSGVLRFAPWILDDVPSFCIQHSLKMATGALSHLSHQDGSWRVVDWNRRP
jgi:2,3-bisphosphoglycerate-dependent phosphoglycerate mutase